MGLNSSITESGAEIFWRINELGRLTDDTGDLCPVAATGEEFNPLTEKNRYGQANPFQDPTRGRIEKCITERIEDPVDGPGFFTN